MRVYVDAAVHQWRGKLWCHLFSPNINDLHVFATKIGMRREWFQDPNIMPKVSWPHYDITSQRRELALRLGAIPVGRHQTVAMSRIVINRYHGLDGTERALDPLSLHRRTNSPMIERVSAWLERELALIDQASKLTTV